MSSIVGAITGSGGAGWEAKSANLLNPATVEQANEQYGHLNTGLQQQQDFVKATQAQNGLGNQSSVFNQLQGVANGTGPNPAQAMLANATGANVANQAALMAGQRGSGANAGLMARQAGMQGANIQQNAAGQGAAMQANQSLGALNQLGGIAGQQVGQQAGATNAYQQGAQQGYTGVTGNINAQNNAAVGNVSQQNSANAGIQKQVAEQQGNMLAGLTGAIGTGVGMMYGGPAGAAIGGSLGSQIGGKFGGQQAMPMKAEGGAIESANKENYGPKSSVGRHFHSLPMMPMLAQGGPVPALVSPGETYLDPQAVAKVKQGADPINSGEKIPGTPKYKGNNYANDTVPKTLQEGGVVIPNAIMQSKDAHKKAAAFVAAVLKKQSLKKG